MAASSGGWLGAPCAMHPSWRHGYALLAVHAQTSRLSRLLPHLAGLDGRGCARIVEHAVLAEREVLCVRSKGKFRYYAWEGLQEGSV